MLEGYVQVQVLNETPDKTEWDKGSITMPAPWKSRDTDQQAISYLAFYRDLYLQDWLKPA